MIKVIKIGKMPDPIVEFTCDNCGCVFTAEEEDYVRCEMGNDNRLYVKKQFGAAIQKMTESALRIQMSESVYWYHKADEWAMNKFGFVSSDFPVRVCEQTRYNNVFYDFLTITGKIFSYVYYNGSWYPADVSFTIGESRVYVGKDANSIYRIYRTSEQDTQFDFDSLLDLCKSPTTLKAFFTTEFGEPCVLTPVMFTESSIVFTGVGNALDTIMVSITKNTSSGEAGVHVQTIPLSFRDEFANIYNELDNAIYPIIRDNGGIIVPSSTEGSTKKFKITVDDSGTISATEFTTETEEPS